jgi:acyl carrier protein
MEIEQRLLDLFRSVFEDGSLEITPATSADDIEAWDSVGHITLVFAIEEAFGFQFTTKELESMRNAGDLQATIWRKLG